MYEYRYTDLVEYTKASDHKRLRFIINQLTTHVTTTENILDVGCGNGIISKAVGKLGYNVRGIDISKKTIDTARQHCDLPNVRFDCVKAEELVLSDERFGGVICSEVLEHLHNPTQFLLVLQKLLAKDGILIITVPNGYGPREVIITKPMQKICKREDRLWKIIFSIKRRLGYDGKSIQSDADELGHIQFFRKKALIDIVSNSGFEFLEDGKGEFIMDVFPYSLLTKRFKTLQDVDCKLADILPSSFSSSIFTCWKR